MKLVIFASVVAAISTSSLAQSKLNLNPAPPQPKTDFQRAIEKPIPPPAPPTALQKLERGQIPTSQNPMPKPREGVSPTLNERGVGVEWRKTFR